MASIRVERLDHLGVIACVIKDLGLIDMINARRVPDAPEVSTPGEAMAGMILNGLGFANRPLSLTPPFFANTPLDLLCRGDIHAAMCNRFQLGRTLEEAYAYGCDLLFHALALAVGAQAGIALRFQHLDTTSCSLRGASGPESEEQAITITHGSSRDHRPDLKPAALELLVSQDGGVPLVSQSWEGNTSDIEVFQARAQAVMPAFKNAPSPRSLSAASTLYPENNASTRQKRGFITRIPNTRGAVSQVLAHALPWDPWRPLHDNTRDQRLEFCHYGRAPRWLVVHSQTALERAEAVGNNARQREEEAIAKPLFHLHATRFQPPAVAQDALAALAKRWTSHQVESHTLSEHQRSACKGRPTPGPPCRPSSGQSRPASGLSRRGCGTTSTSKPALCWARISAPTS